MFLKNMIIHKSFVQSSTNILMEFKLKNARKNVFDRHNVSGKYGEQHVTVR